jgi:pimeloyl-ACP methyl ester carboxylesterase
MIKRGLDTSASSPSPFLRLDDPLVAAHSARIAPKMPQDDVASRVVRSTFQHLGEVAPGLLSAMAERLFTTPKRIPAPPRERAHIAAAEHRRVSTSVGRLALSRWVAAELPWEAPARETVILLHGWQGRGSQLCAFVDPLLQAGLDVVAIDGPGHGRSSGERADVGTFSMALREVGAALADDGHTIRAVIGHSMGAGATALAVADGLDVQAAVLIAPPRSVATVTDDFAAALGMSARTEQALKKRLRRRFHPYLWDRVAIDDRVADVCTRALVIHDVGDIEVPFARGRAVAEAWPGARLLPTQGLGHRRILRDDNVVAAAVAFIAGPPS